MNLRRYLAIAAAVVTGSFALAGSASATTFCVPGFTTACPDNGSNVAMATFTQAGTSDGSDGDPDKIVIAAGTLSEADTLYAEGSDPLEVVGAGTDQTRVTITDTSPVFVMTTFNRSGEVKLGGFTVVIPAGFPDGDGAGLLIKGAQVDGVNVESRNPSSSALPDLQGSNQIQNMEIYAADGGSVNVAIGVSGAIPATATTLSRLEIRDSAYGVVAGYDGRASVSNSRITDPSGAAVRAIGGGVLSVDNSIIEARDMGYAVQAQTVDNFVDLTWITLKNTTVVGGPNSGQYAIDGQVVSDTGGGDLDIDIEDSIFHGFSKNWKLGVPVGPGFGGATLDVKFSNFADTPANDSGGAVTITDGIDADPLFVGAGDYHLRPGSPSVDAGNPAAGGLAVDFEGNARPFDGDQNGVAVRDQGAYELLASCPTDPTLCPDTTRPKITKVKFRFKRGKGGALRMRVSKAATVRATFKPVPKKKRKVVRLRKKAAKPGAVVFRLGKKRLKPGRYVIRITATDELGITSRTVVRRIKVKR